MKTVTFYSFDPKGDNFIVRGTITYDGKKLTASDDPCVQNAVEEAIVLAGR